MYIIEDTKQKKGAHDEKYKAWKNDIVYRCMLPYGDYALPPAISVDTKANLEELASNLCGSKDEKDRVIREEKRAKELGGQLVFLTEEDGIERRCDLLDRMIYLRSGQVVTGEQLIRAMDTHEHTFGSRFEFCSKKDAGEKVKKILSGG